MLHQALRAALVWGVLLAAQTTARAATPPPLPIPDSAVSAHAVDPAIKRALPPPEPTVDSLGLNLDEHLLVDGPCDHDYAGGGDIFLSGSLAAGSRLDSLLGGINDHLPFAAGSHVALSAPTHPLAAGLLVFTPATLAQFTPVKGDRPYASLFFLSNGRRYLATKHAIAYESSLTFGMLGLSAAGSLQSALHHLTGSVQPQGWRHQISAGGEPTLRYSRTREALLVRRSRNRRIGYDLKWASAASVGTLTEGSVSLALRWGRIASPWWAFSPEEDMYADEPVPAPPPLPTNSGPELFAFFDVRTKLRLYNAFFQGQFRHSDLHVPAGDLNVLLGEAWAGIEYRTSGFEISYLVRFESPELSSGIGSRSLLWGNVELATSFGG